MARESIWRMLVHSELLPPSLRVLLGRSVLWCTWAWCGVSHATSRDLSLRKEVQQGQVLSTLWSSWQGNLLRSRERLCSSLLCGWSCARMVAYRRCISPFHAKVSACLLRKSVCWAQPCQTVSHKKAEIDVEHLVRCCLPSGQAAAAEMWRAPCCTRRAGRRRGVVRYHVPIEQACAAEM